MDQQLNNYRKHNFRAGTKLVHHNHLRNCFNLFLTLYVTRQEKKTNVLGPAVSKPSASWGFTFYTKLVNVTCSAFHQRALFNGSQYLFFENTGSRRMVNEEHNREVKIIPLCL